MKKAGSFAVCCVCLLVAGTAYAGGTLKAKAEMLDSKGRCIGHATLAEQKNGVQVKLKVSGLSPGKHGFHIHETGTCTPPDFKSAGGHFNPFDKHHGIENPDGKHAGDFPNLVVKNDGKAEVTAVAEGATLKRGKPGSLFKEGGTAIVIHADPDDNMSDPAGNAGARIACGVIVKAK